MTMHDEIVLMKDDRKPVREVLQQPFRWVCSLEVEFPEPVIYTLGTLEDPDKSWVSIEPSKKGCGSGLLISPVHLLTAAHVVAGFKIVGKGKQKRFVLVEAKTVKIIPARQNNGNEMPFGSFYADRIHISHRFKKQLEHPIARLSRDRIKKCLSVDYAVVELRSDKIPGTSLATLKFGWWRQSHRFKIEPVATDGSRGLKGREMHVAGYPGEKGPVSCGALWEATGKIRAVAPNINGEQTAMLLYDADTSAGMSGSPVWIKTYEDIYNLAGIHSSFIDYPNEMGISKTYNACALVTKTMMRELRSFGIGYLEVLMRKYRTA